MGGWVGRLASPLPLPSLCYQIKRRTYKLYIVWNQEGDSSVTLASPPSYHDPLRGGGGREPPPPSLTVNLFPDYCGR